MSGGICCCQDGDSRRCPIHQNDVDAAELIGVASGLDDLANGRVRALNDIRRELSGGLVVVHWPGKNTIACPKHLRKLVGLAAVLGLPLGWTPTTEGECDNCRTEKLRNGGTE